MLCIAVFLAVISMFFVRPDRAYAEYIDTRVLALLFCLMTIMEGFKKTGLFEQMANTLLKKVHTFRQLMLVLVGLCFFCSDFCAVYDSGAAYGKTGSADDSGDYHGDDSCQSWKYGNSGG